MPFIHIYLSKSKQPKKQLKDTWLALWRVIRFPAIFLVKRRVSFRELPAPLGSQPSFSMPIPWPKIHEIQFPHVKSRHISSHSSWVFFYSCGRLYMSFNWLFQWDYRFHFYGLISVLIQFWGPLVMFVVFSAPVTIVINTINHIVIGFINQLSYLGGLTL